SIGQTLFSQGQYEEAEKLFRQLLQQMEKENGYEYCSILSKLGRCLRLQGNAKEAINYYRQAITIAQDCDPTNELQRQMGLMYADLGDLLREIGEYGEAKENLEISLEIKKNLGDIKGKAVTNGQLASLAYMQDNLLEAEKRYKETLKAFQSLNEPVMEAQAWHHLGMVYKDAKRWEAAETYYRKSAEIQVNLGNIKDVAKTWEGLAHLYEDRGRIQDAESWHRKAIEGYQQSGDKMGLASNLSNFAKLLQNQENRLAEA
ncbi:MAG: tetratricopeptide repeat protein, partial [Cyanobacteria bacterium P01_G01_bin.49]